MPPRPQRGGAMASSGQPRPTNPLSRRRFLGATAGAAAAMTVIPSTAYAEDLTNRGGEPTVLPANRGIILYTVRDVITRAPNAATGLGGGFRYAFENLAKMGYKQVE